MWENMLSYSSFPLPLPKLCLRLLHLQQGCWFLLSLYLSCFLFQLIFREGWEGTQGVRGEERSNVMGLLILSQRGSHSPSSAKRGQGSYTTNNFVTISVDLIWKKRQDTQLWVFTWIWQCINITACSTSKLTFDMLCIKTVWCIVCSAPAHNLLWVEMTDEVLQEVDLRISGASSLLQCHCHDGNNASQWPFYVGPAIFNLSVSL